MGECEHYRELISALIDGEVSESENAEIRAHIESCPECRAMFDAFTAVSDSLSELEELPDGVHESIMRGVRASEKKKKPAWTRVLPLAACLVMVIFGSFKLLNAPDTDNAAMNDKFAVTDDSEVSEINDACEAAPASRLENGGLNSLLAPADGFIVRSGETKTFSAQTQYDAAFDSAEKAAPDYTVTLDGGETVSIYFIDGIAFADFGDGLVEIKGTPEEIKNILG